MSGQPRANVEQDNLSFVIDTVRPLCVKWEQELNRVLLTEREILSGYSVRMNLGALLRGDLKSRYEAYAIGRQWGWYSANDIRALEGLDEIDGGDTYLTPSNMLDANAPRPTALPAQPTLSDAQQK